MKLIELMKIIKVIQNLTSVTAIFISFYRDEIKITVFACNYCNFTK